MNKVAQLFLCAWLTTTTVAIAEESTLYGPIKSGELLWNVASAVVTDKSVTRHQVMLALLKANPQAFVISCNLHSLKTGKKLQVPTLAEIQAINPADALKEVTRQKAEWETHRKQPKNITCAPQEKTSLQDMQAKTADPVTPIPSTSTSSQSNPETTSGNGEPPKKSEQVSPSPVASSQPQPVSPDAKATVASTESSATESPAKGTPEQTTENTDKTTPSAGTETPSEAPVNDSATEAAPSNDERLVPPSENTTTTPVPPVATTSESSTATSPPATDKPKPPEAEKPPAPSTAGSAIGLALGVTVAVFLLAMLLSWLLRTESTTRPIPGEEI